MSRSVTVHSRTQNGQVQTITILQTGASTANIAVTPDPGFGSHDDVDHVKADANALTMTCQIKVLFTTADISIVVQRGGAGASPVATVTVAHALIGNGIYQFSLTPGDDAALQSFLQSAGFPPQP